MLTDFIQHANEGDRAAVFLISGEGRGVQRRGANV
jgi:hypothetical protein